jgi:hypothetical protein
MKGQKERARKEGRKGKRSVGKGRREGEINK